jgi:RHS repeat-associated protein
LKAAKHILLLLWCLLVLIGGHASASFMRGAENRTWEIWNARLEVHPGKELQAAERQRETSQARFKLTLGCVEARYYDPASGRFLSPDPLGHGSDMSLYAYCNGDPVNGLDPDGRLASLAGRAAWNEASLDASALTSSTFWGGMGRSVVGGAGVVVYSVFGGRAAYAGVNASTDYAGWTNTSSGTTSEQLQYNTQIAQLTGATQDVVFAVAGAYDGNGNIVPRVTAENSSGSLLGSPTVIPPGSDAATARALTLENQSAVILSENGYNVVQNPVVTGPKNPDYLINGEIFDNYAPSTGNIRNIASNVEAKVLSGQANNIVVTLIDSSATPAALKSQLTNYPISGLKTVIVVDQTGGVSVIH